MDLLWLIPRFRKRRIEQARAAMQSAQTVVSNIRSTLQPYAVSQEYIPERVIRPLLSQVNELNAVALPPIAKTVYRAKDATMQKRLESITRDSDQLQGVLTRQNDEYVQRMITAHSKLLVDELGLDAAQRVAAVRDDERNLVIAAAGSGKTRTLIARVRYLLERGIGPSSVLSVTFTNKATEEMEDRLKQMGVPIADGGDIGVTVSTLHALGKRVVQAKFLGPISVADTNWTESLVAEALRDARSAKDSDLAQLYLNAIFNFHRDKRESELDQAPDLTYRTLRGEHVRSVGERIVADFLFTHHVEYKYEGKALWAQVAAGRGAYHPDFALLHSGIYIEYWGINRKGEVPASWAQHGGTTSTGYRTQMEWKRNQFRQQGRALIEVYDYERTEGVLEKVLRERLAASGVALPQMTLEELEEAVRDIKYIGDAIERLLVQFVSNARSLRLEPSGIPQRLNQSSPRVYHFGLLGTSILARYENQLRAEGRIDFADMLHRAADILESGTNPLPKFEHILVDEFQDTSAAMARFLRALLLINNARLFAVGDDWQAIYGFAGGDVDHIVKFEDRFGYASKTMLNVNYRSPSLIVEAGSALIAHNPNQIPKQIEVSSQEHGEAYVHEAPDDDSSLVSETIRLVQEERARTKNDRDILVLSRTNHILGRVQEACRARGIPVGNPERNIGGVRVLSGHKAKGIEASVVIVVNASDHIFGFPSKVENPDVLAPVRMSSGNDEAEERRLFYVAVTRTMKRLHLIVRQGLPSPYVAEIEGSVPIDYPAVNQSVPVRPGFRFSDTFHVKQIYSINDRQKRAGIRQTGLLSTNTDRFRFTSFLPFDLDESGTYWLEDVFRDQPYGDLPQLRLDAMTRVESRRSPVMTRANPERTLVPRPPPAYQPTILPPAPKQAIRDL